MNKPIFNNRENEEVTLPDGRTKWLSRSAAVVGIILGIVEDNIYVLTEKRSKLMDEPHKWCVICGYLDWDEDGYEGIVRETYEETSFYIPMWENRLCFDNDKQPFYVNTNPRNDEKQNVSLTYVFIYKFNNKLPRSFEMFKCREVDQIKWMEISEIYQGNKECAFEHDLRIEMAIQKYKKYLI